MGFSCASGTGCSVTSAHRSLCPCSRRVTAAATRVLLATPVMAAMRDAIVRAITTAAAAVATSTGAMPRAVKAAGAIARRVAATNDEASAAKRDTTIVATVHGASKGRLRAARGLREIRVPRAINDHPQRVLCRHEIRWPAA